MAKKDRVGADLEKDQPVDVPVTDVTVDDDPAAAAGDQDDNAPLAGDQNDGPFDPEAKDAEGGTGDGDPVAASTPQPPDLSKPKTDEDGKGFLIPQGGVVLSNGLQGSADIHILFDKSKGDWVVRQGLDGEWAEMARVGDLKPQKRWRRKPKGE